jgi:hypothetical protein
MFIRLIGSPVAGPAGAATVSCEGAEVWAETLESLGGVVDGSEAADVAAVVASGVAPLLVPSLPQEASSRPASAIVHTPKRER